MVREMPLSPGVIRVAETVQGKAFTMEPDIFIGAHSRFSLERTPFLKWSIGRFSGRLRNLWMIHGRFIHLNRNKLLYHYHV